ncbi:hypothetical protein ACLOJK_037441 [Asimina triloba]
MTTSSMHMSVIGVALLAMCHAAVVVPSTCRRAAGEREEAVVPLPLTEAVEADDSEDEAGSTRSVEMRQQWRQTTPSWEKMGEMGLGRPLRVVSGVPGPARPCGPDAQCRWLDGVLAGDDDEAAMIRWPDDDGEENAWSCFSDHRRSDQGHWFGP